MAFLGISRPRQCHHNGSTCPFCGGSGKAGLPLMPARAFSRTETIGSVITIIFSGSKLIVFRGELIFSRPKIIISSAQKTIAGTKIIMSLSNHIASLPDLIVLEAKSIMSGVESIISRTELIIGEVKLTVLKAKAFISGPDLIIGVTNMIISAPLFFLPLLLSAWLHDSSLSELGCPAGEGAWT